MGIALFLFKASRIIVVFSLIIAALLWVAYPFLQSWAVESIKLPNGLAASIPSTSFDYEDGVIIVNIPNIVLRKKNNNSIFAIAENSILKINLAKILQEEVLSLSISQIFININTIKFAGFNQESNKWLDYFHWIEEIKLNNILLIYKDISQSQIELSYYNNKIKINAFKFDLSMLHLSTTNLPAFTIEGIIELDAPNNKFNFFGRAKNEDINLSIDFVSEKNSQTLKVTGNNFAVNSLKKYLPTKYLSSSVSTWLDEAFIDGVGHNLNFSLYQKYPFDDYLLNFKADFEQINLNFDNQWPNVVASGHIEINNNDINVKATNGKIANLVLKNISADIVNIKDATPILTVNIEANNKSQHLLDFLTIKPLKEQTPDLPFLSLLGDSQSKLELIIPLVGPQVDGELDIYVKVDNEFINNKLLIANKQRKVEATAVNAQLMFVTKANKGLLNIEGKGDVLDNEVLFSIIDKNKKLTANLKYKQAKLKLSSKHKQNKWRAKLTNQGSEIEVVISPDFDKYVMDIAIKNANIVRKSDGNQLADLFKTKTSSFTLVPEDVPKIFLTSKKVRVNDYLLPELDLVITPSVETVALSGRVNIDNILILDLKGFWIYDEYRRSQVKIDIQSHGDELADLLSLIGGKKTVSNAKFRLDIGLFCECTPWLLDIDSLKGQANLNIESGVLNGQNTGIGELLSLLSVRSLEQKLSVDTSELKNKGFAFQGIKIKMDLHDNKINVSNFKLSSLTTDISIGGSANLKNKTIDFKAEVTPALSDSVPLVTLLAGGGLAGLGLWLVDKATFDGKLLKTLLDKNATFEYHITGDWHKPDIK